MGVAVSQEERDKMVRLDLLGFGLLEISRAVGRCHAVVGRHLELAKLGVLISKNIDKNAVVDMYDNGKGKTMTAIAKHLNCGRTRVAEILHEAGAVMREKDSWKLSPKRKEIANDLLNTGLSMVAIAAKRHVSEATVGRVKRAITPKHLQQQVDEWRAQRRG